MRGTFRRNVAFALFDEKQNQLFLSRDRFAEKTMHYSVTNEGIYFGSEVKFLEELAGRKFDVNNQHLYRYLVNGHKSLYKTSEGWYKDVFNLSLAQT